MNLQLSPIFKSNRNKLLIIYGKNYSSYMNILIIKICMSFIYICIYNSITKQV